MTNGAISRKGILVIVGVASQAFLTESQECVLLFLYIDVFDVAGLVARSALRCRMGSLKFIPGQSVIKLLFVKTDHIEFSSMVFAVAGKTILAGNFSTRVVAFFLFYQRLNFFMTFQALVVVNFFTEIVA